MKKIILCLALCSIPAMACDDIELIKYKQECFIETHKHLRENTNWWNSGLERQQAEKICRIFDA